MPTWFSPEYTTDALYKAALIVKKTDAAKNSKLKQQAAASAAAWLKEQLKRS
jgi:hypothetical protein